MIENSAIRRRLLGALSLMLTLSLAPAARAQLKILITSGVTDPIPIAVVPFAGNAGATDVAQIVSQDLTGSGRFKVMPRGKVAATPARAAEVVAADWKAAGEDYVVVGRMSDAGGGQSAIEFDLVNSLTGQTLASQRFVATPAAQRDAAHRISDVIYEKILGVRGAFATRIAYVSVLGTPPAQRFQLVVADADGANPRVILESAFPIMSPAWSPDGQWLAYVSFEHKHSAIWVQQVRSGERRQVSARVGINGSPAWSPDGRRLLVALSGSSGYPNLYILDLSTQQLTRLTEGPFIDTEGVWSNDGRSVYFTSDRSGGPQIYSMAAEAGGRPRRITFSGGYNARPRVSPDGTKLALVTQEGGNYRIAVQDLASGAVQVLSKGHQDSSPSFAPNGAMLICSSAAGGHTTLQRVSVDGQTSQSLSADGADVREPVWAPFERQ